eukprot:1146658-Pelagomonas_calceolata.AAC.3
MPVTFIMLQLCPLHAVRLCHAASWQPCIHDSFLSLHFQISCWEGVCPSARSLKTAKDLACAPRVLVIVLKLTQGACPCLLKACANPLLSNAAQIFQGRAPHFFGNF